MIFTEKCSFSIFDKKEKLVFFIQHKFFFFIKNCCFFLNLFIKQYGFVIMLIG